MYWFSAYIHEFSSLRQRGHNIHHVYQHQHHRQQEHILVAKVHRNIAASKRPHGEGQTEGGESQTIGRRSMLAVHTIRDVGEGQREGGRKEARDAQHDAVDVHIGGEGQHKHR